MPSFMEKLKKGMGMEGESQAGSAKRITAKAKKVVRRKQPKVTITSVSTKTDRPKRLAIREVSLEEEEKPEEKLEEEKLEEEKTEEEPLTSEVSIAPELEPEEDEQAKWFESEGQLAIDVYQTTNDLVVQAAIAGISPDSLDIIMENDVITVKGMREKPFEEKGDYFSQECFWGSFSREVILPVDVDPNRAVAEMKEGVLTVRIPKILREKKRKIIVRNA